MSRRASIQPHRHDDFTRDWLHGVRLREMAAKFDCSQATVSATAQCLALPRRHGGEVLDIALTGGRWAPGRHGVLTWQADAA